MRCSGQVEWLRDRGASLPQVGGNLALNLGGGRERVGNRDEGKKRIAAWLQFVLGVDTFCIICWDSLTS